MMLEEGETGQVCVGDSGTYAHVTSPLFFENHDEPHFRDYGIRYGTKPND